VYFLSQLETSNDLLLHTLSGIKTTKTNMHVICFFGFIVG
jgi:hypothetical protein